MSGIDLSVEAERLTRASRLVEQVLLDRLVDRATAARRMVGQAETLVAVVWVANGPATIYDQTYDGNPGQLHLLPHGAAQGLADEGYADVREPLRLEAGQRAEAAAELWEVASELQAAALALHPRTVVATAAEGEPGSASRAPAASLRADP